MSGVDMRDRIDQAIDGSPIDDNSSGRGQGDGEQGSGSSPKARLALESTVRTLAIAGMMACLSVSFGQFIALFAPDFARRAFSWMAFAIALEGIHSQGLMARRRLDGRDRMRYWFVEWVVILLVVRFGFYLEYGYARLVADAAKWTVELGAFFDLGYLFNAAIMAAFWALARMLAKAVDELRATALERRLPSTAPHAYLRATMPHQGRTDRQARLRRIVGVFMGGGIAMLLMVGFTSVDVRDLVVLQHARTRGVILNVLVYFMLGFLIFSEAHYTMMRANWDIQGIPVASELAKRWMVLVIGFLLVLGIVSAVLPVSYSVGILQTLSTVIQWIIYAVVKVVFGILFGISLVFGLLMSLFNRPAPAAATPAARPAPQPLIPSQIAGDPNPWWLVLRSVIFWAVVLGVVGYSLYHFVGDRWGIGQGLSLGKLWSWLRKTWRRAQRSTRAAGQNLRQAIENRLAQRRARNRLTPFGYVSLRRLSPRDRVRYYYLSVLRRGKAQGIGRPLSSTPLEFVDTLASAMPDVDPDVRELTDGFVLSRYSQRPVSRDDARAVQQLWRHVKRALVARRRSRRSAQTADSRG